MTKRPYGKLTRGGGGLALRIADENAGAARGLSVASRGAKSAPLGGGGGLVRRGGLTKIFPTFPAPSADRGASR